MVYISKIYHIKTQYKKGIDVEITPMTFLVLKDNNNNWHRKFDKFQTGIVINMLSEMFPRFMI